MLTRSLVGDGTPFYYVVQVTTAVILLLAANTGFSGFPRLASILANDRFMPRQFAFRGDRLAFSTGIVALAVMAAIVLAAFGGSVTNLIPLYTIGVFVAFTLSQSGLVRRWWRLRNPGWRSSMAINIVGGTVTGVVLVVVAVTKFTLGAWMVLILLPALVLLLYAISRHYIAIADALLIPLQCEYFALEGLSQLLNTVNLVQQGVNPSLGIDGVLLTMYDARLNLSRQVAADAREYFGAKVFQSIVPRNVRLAEAPGFGKPIILYDLASVGAQAYMSVAKELIERTAAEISTR